VFFGQKFEKVLLVDRVNSRKTAWFQCRTLDVKVLINNNKHSSGQPTFHSVQKELTFWSLMHCKGRKDFINCSVYADKFTIDSEICLLTKHVVSIIYNRLQNINTVIN